jgi:predicted RNA-binding Zn-ribbon protein involved in translation (DUF1610 family)
MAADLFHCPSCGAPVTPRGSASTVNCPYCHASVVVPEELRQTSNAASWSTQVYDGFISNNNDWLVGSQAGEYFAPLDRVIADGRYRWDAKHLRTSSSITTARLRGYPVSDFHLIANCKRVRGSRGGSSWGVIFRQDNDRYYNFHITDDRFFAVSVNIDGEWVTIVEWATTNTIKPNGVNQLEVIANGTHFTFLINGKMVSEIDDDHLSHGLVGLSIEAYTLQEEITFDFLDFTLRAPNVE